MTARHRAEFASIISATSGSASAQEGAGLARDIHRRRAMSERPPAPEDRQLLLDLAHERTYLGGIRAHTHRCDHRVDRPAGMESEAETSRIR
jgi:hypothetical protein